MSIQKTAKDFGYDFENDGVLYGRRPEDYIAGQNSPLSFESRNPSGDWTKYLPVGEVQFGKQDWMDCVSRSLTNAAEVVIKFFNGAEENKNDRVLAIRSGTTQQGNFLYRVADLARKEGLSIQTTYPDSGGTWNEQYAPIPNPPLDQLLVEGREFLEKWDVKYEWVEKKDWVKHLKHAPLQAIIPGHAVVIVKIEGDQATYFDSYHPFVKVLPVSSFRDYALKLVMTPKIMSNVKILKDENSQLLVFALPVTNPEALKSLGMNFGREIPQLPNGEVDFSKLRVDGSFRL